MDSTLKARKMIALLSVAFVCRSAGVGSVAGACT